MQIASFSPHAAPPSRRFAVHCLAPGAASRYLFFSPSLLFLFSIVRQSPSPLFATQHKSVPGHSRHSTDAPNNDPLWKLPPICYLNGETAPEVREVTGAAGPRRVASRGAGARGMKLCSGWEQQNVRDSTLSHNTRFQGDFELMKNS